MSAFATVRSSRDPNGRPLEEHERLSQAVQRELDQRVLATTTALAWSFSVVYALFGVAHLLYLTGELRTRLVSLAGATSLVCFGLALVLPRRPPPLRAAHAIQALVCALPLINSGAHLLWTLDVKQTTNIALVQLAAGFLMLSSAWFSVFTVASLGFVVVAYNAGQGGREWEHFLFMMSSAVAAAITVHVIHLRAVRRSERERILTDVRTQARLSQQETIAHIGHLAVEERETATFLESCAQAVAATLAATWVRIERPSAEHAVAGARAAGGYEESARSTIDGRDAVLTVQLESAPIASIGPFLQSVVHLAAMRLRRAEVEEQRLDAERRLLHAQRMESIALLAGGVAHDFNNLLTVILSHADALRYRHGLDAETRGALDQVLSAAQLAARLTHQLLAFSRKQPRHVENFDLRHVVTHIEPMISRTIRESIHIALQLSDQACTVHADRAQLEQVVMNLVVNARDALSAEGTIEIGLDLVTLDDSGSEAGLGIAAGKYVVLRVSDTGSGISEAVLPHIFEPFFTTKDVDHGTGLGLATVHGIVHQCAGQIRVRSTPGVGTTFLIYLPFADPAVSAETEERLRLVAAPQKQCILVVEDNRAVREVVVQTLRKARYDVIEAGGGAEALAASRRHAGAVDLLLSDVVMPNMSGIELAERLLVDRPTLPIMLMSGHLGDETELARLSGHAALRLLRKPFTAAELLRAVEEFVAACNGRAGAAAS